MSDNKKCFIIMPITTPENEVNSYKDDGEHFEHVLNYLFIPAIKEAGFEPILPKSTGAELIHAEIIKNLSNSEMVLCDMSILNANVFFEFGIRTALDKPISLITDDKTTHIPFDAGIINCHKYKSALNAWELEKEKTFLTQHIKASSEKSNGRNALWKYFGVAQTGTFKPEEATIGEKMDLLIKEVESIKATNLPSKKNEGYSLGDFCGNKEVIGIEFLKKATDQFNSEK